MKKTSGTVDGCCTHDWAKKEASVSDGVGDEGEMGEAGEVLGASGAAADGRGEPAGEEPAGDDWAGTAEAGLMRMTGTCGGGVGGERVEWAG